MDKWFVPYLYFPDADATYFKLVTPFGNVHLTNEQLFKGVVTLVTVVVGFLFYRWCFDVLKKRDDDDDDEEDDEEEDDEQAKEFQARVKRATKSQQKKLTQAEKQARSALEASIAQKGANSYYYAHQPREVKDDDDDNNNKSNKLIKSAVTTYGWTDKKDRICIYLTDGFLIDFDHDNIRMNWTATSLSLDLVLDEHQKRAKSLVISTLYDPITDATWKLRNNRLTITLTKQNPGHEWKSLNGAARNLEDHVRYDPSLYD